MDDRTPDHIRGPIFLGIALRLEQEGRPNLAKLYLQRAIACERWAGSR